MTPKKRIAVLTGIRSEYDILYSTLKAIQEHPDLELQVIVAGAHLAPRYGYSVRQIEADGFPIVERIENLLDSDRDSGRAKSAAIEFQALVQTLDRIRPDYLLVAGDREESIVGAMVCCYLNLPIAHIAGGDLVVGNVDDSVRHAVSKLAHLHFPLSEESADRLRRMGESPWRVNSFGNPALDRFRILPRLSRQELSQRLDFDITQGPVLLVIQHTLSSEVSDAAQQMRITLDAIAELGYRTLIGYPNSDAGGRELIDTIEAAARNLPFVKVYRNLPRLEFTSLLQTVDVLLGNSSLGLLEAPFLKLPVINIGNRQMKRQHAENIAFVPHDKGRIMAAVKLALNDEEYKERVRHCSNPFGDGHTGERIAQTLAETPVDSRLLIKDWTL